MDEKCCEVHGTKLESRTFPIIYGFPARPPDPGDRIMDFPHAETETFGGCLVSFDQPEEVTQVVCPACVEAKEAWLKSLELD
ncbi:MAG: hypothetical protein LC113_05420 [Acidobacteria bacterium]|nr:hypothetical protein [Acidobacteriota bacterium]